jgi:hypothetical protein
MPSLHQHPPKALSVRKDDYRRFPRENFGFVFEGLGGFKVDTHAGIATKGISPGRDTTITLRLSNDEIEAIYRKAIHIRFFEYPEPGPPLEVYGYQTSTDGISRLVMTAGATTKSLAWDNSKVPGGRSEDDWKRLFELVLLIYDTIAAHDEYKALPEWGAIHA